MFEVKIEVDEGRHHAAPGHDDGERDRDRVDRRTCCRFRSRRCVSEAGYSYVYKKDGSRVVRQMIETGATNDNEIVVKKGLSKDDRVCLTPPADKASIKTEMIAGLKPIVAPRRRRTRRRA